MLPKTCQMLLFSATFEDTVWNFAKRIVPDPNIIKLKREEETLDTIKQYYVICNSKEEKFQALCNIYGAITIAQAMIFCHVNTNNVDIEVFFRAQTIVIHNHEICYPRPGKPPGGWQESCPEKATRWRCSAERCRWNRGQRSSNVSVMARRKFSLPLMSVLEVYRLSVILLTISSLVRDKHGGFVSSTRY